MADKDILGATISARYIKASGREIDVELRLDKWGSQRKILIDITRPEGHDERGIMLTRDSAIALAHQLLTITEA